jgi:hypothetical protein
MPALPELSELPCGRYHHHKGNEYEVIAVVRHSETLETMVLYKALYGDGGLWVRPYAMFVEHVLVDDRPVRRFALVNDVS